MKAFFLRMLCSTPGASDSFLKSALVMMVQTQKGYHQMYITSSLSENVKLSMNVRLCVVCYAQLSGDRKRADFVYVLPEWSSTGSLV